MNPPTSTPAQLDRLSGAEVVERLLAVEERVVPAVRARRGAIAAAAELVHDRMVSGGRLLFAGAGTSGRLALAEAAELPGTFGIAPERVGCALAGGLREPGEASDSAEDDVTLAERDLAALDPGPGDALVAVAASGRTPYTLRLAEGARSRGAAVIAVVTTAGSPLAALAAVAVEVELGVEALRDSTRLAAGTAQKVVLNALTTAAMVRLGHVHDDLMIDVRPANAKLRARSEAIVAEIAGCSVDEARRALAVCSGNVRGAVVSIVLGLPPDQAVARAQQHKHLRDALRS